MVEADPRTRERMGSWLERAGYEVLTCRGPSAPDYSCLAGRHEPCPLALEADAIVLDLHLASDTLVVGTPSWEILLYYVSLHKPVVALVGEEDPIRPVSDEEVTVLRRPVRKGGLVGAVSRLLVEASPPA